MYFIPKLHNVYEFIIIGVDFVVGLVSINLMKFWIDFIFQRKMAGLSSTLPGELKPTRLFSQ